MSCIAWREEQGILKYLSFNTSYQVTMNFKEIVPIYNDDYGNDGTEVPAEIGF